MLVNFARILAVVLCATAFAAAPQAQRPTAPLMDVYKTPTCGCCTKWVDHMREAGFRVQAMDVTQAELDSLKAKYGLPANAHSCHTGLVAGYLVEGHIPASEVWRLLKERPNVVGLTVPGMPLGSPGMEVVGVKPRPYDVFTFDKQGRLQVFSTQRP